MGFWKAGPINVERWCELGGIGHGMFVRTTKGHNIRERAQRLIMYARLVMSNIEKLGNISTSL